MGASAGAGLACLGALALLSAATPGGAPGPGPPAAEAGEPITPLPAEEIPETARVRLGEVLFGDVRLSGANDTSCATCHDLARGGDDGQVRPRGGRLPYNTPTVFNAGLSFRLNWRGNHRSLEQLVESVLLDDALMNASWDKVLAELRADPDYQRRFLAAYGAEPRPELVVDALAAFGRSLVTPDAPFDRYLRGDRTALTREQEEGYRLFKDYGCVSCHQGVNVGGNLFQRFGIFGDQAAGRRDDDPSDLGRFTLTGRPEDRRVFRVPSLRNVAVTAPYFHDGRAATLGMAVEAMARSQLGRTLTTVEVDRIVAFLGSLTGRHRGRPLAAEGP